MKKRTISFLLLGGIVVFLLLEIWTENKMNSLANKDLYVLNAENQTFTMNDISRLSVEGYDFSPYGEEMLEVETWRSKKTTLVIAVNENWEYIAKEKMVQGTWFNGLQVRQKSAVAVLNRQAAIQFFGTSYAVKNEITIDGRSYTIVGVVEDREESPQIYISYINMQTYHKPNFRIFELWVLLNNPSEKQLLLTKLGYDVEEVDGFCMESYQRVIQMRSRGMIFLIGFYLVLRLFMMVKKKGKETLIILKIFLENHYFTKSYSLLKRQRIQKNLLFMAGSILLIFFICKVTWFSPIFPSEEYMEHGMGIFGWLRRGLLYYIQPELTVQRYDYFHEWNIFSIVSCFIFLIFTLLYVIWIMQMHKQTKN